jgi:hypothetical protein
MKTKETPKLNAKNQKAQTPQSKRKNEDSPNHKIHVTPILTQIPINKDAKNVGEIANDNNPNEMIIHHANAIVEECQHWGTVVQVTQWVNNTGFDIILCTKAGSFQQISITKEEFVLANKMVNKLINTK